MSDFNMVSSAPILSRIEEELQSYSANGVLDTGKLYVQLKWFSQMLGLAVFEKDEVILKLKDFRAELPCNFYALDSAWLCDQHGSKVNLNFQAQLQVYTQKTCEEVINHGNCYLPNTNQLYVPSISACNMNTPLTKTDIVEYVASPNNNILHWRHPTLLRLTPGKSIKRFCSKDCQNIFSHCPDEISINKQGDSYYLFSTLREPVIYIEYYSYPISKEDGLPLVPEDAILQEALFSHLEYYFFRQIYLNGDDTNLENKIKFLKEESESKMNQALTLSKMPSFNKMVQLGRRVRNKWSSYEVLGRGHY